MAGIGAVPGALTVEGIDAEPATLGCCTGLAIEEGSEYDGASVGTEDGRAGIPGGDCAPGTPGNENNSLNDGNDCNAPG